MVKRRPASAPAPRQPSGTISSAREDETDLHADGVFGEVERFPYFHEADVRVSKRSAIWPAQQTCLHEDFFGGGFTRTSGDEAPGTPESLKRARELGVATLEAHGHRVPALLAVALLVEPPVEVANCPLTCADAVDLVGSLDALAEWRRMIAEQGVPPHQLDELARLAYVAGLNCAWLTARTADERADKFHRGQVTGGERTAEKRRRSKKDPKRRFCEDCGVELKSRKPNARYCRKHRLR